MFQQDFKKFESNVFHETPEGYLTGKLCVTGAGVFRYLGDDRKFIGRLRSVDQVKDATGSLNCKPITLQHPNQPVSLDNVTSLSVGMSSNDATFDGLNNFVTVTVTDPKAVQAIKNGEVKAISCGYKCNVVDNAGVWQGSKHEQEQKDIVYNHIALVREGRAGDQVRFCVGDSAEAEDIFGIDAGVEPAKVDTSAPVDMADGKKEFKDDIIHKQKEQSMKTIQLDGVDYEADEKVIEALQTAQDDASTKLDEIHTLLDGISERDTRIAELEDQLENANDEVDESLIDEAVNAKLAILDAARMAGIECETSDDVSELKRKVIKAAFDSIELDSIEDESAINALFASAKGVLESASEGEDDDEEKKDDDDQHDSAPEVNPAAQFDGAQKRSGLAFEGDSMEDALSRQLYNISNGIKA